MEELGGGKTQDKKNCIGFFFFEGNQEKMMKWSRPLAVDSLVIGLVWKPSCHLCIQICSLHWSSLSSLLIVENYLRCSSSRLTGCRGHRKTMVEGERRGKSRLFLLSWHSASSAGAASPSWLCLQPDNLFLHDPSSWWVASTMLGFLLTGPSFWALVALSPPFVPLSSRVVITYCCC